MPWCAPVEPVHQLRHTSARVFINGTTRVNEAASTLAISKIFKWYRADFRKNDEELIRFIVSYLYDEKQADWLSQNGENVTITYLDYDWRLNR